VDSLNAGFCGEVITRDDTILGYIFTQHGANECHILNLCITPQYQGIGLASKLLALTLEKSIQRGDYRVYLEVRESNLAAIHLYEKYGFIEVGRRKDYYPAPGGNEDALLLTKELT
jgi:ribosomal-protein-alanine N-acetyltransferase